MSQCHPRGHDLKSPPNFHDVKETITQRVGGCHQIGIHLYPNEREVTVIVKRFGRKCAVCGKFFEEVMVK